MMIKKLRKSIDLKRNYFHDYGLKLNTQNKIIIKKNFCSLLSARNWLCFKYYCCRKS